MINYPEKDIYTYDDLVDILRILRAHDAPPEYFAWMGLEAPRGHD